MGRFEIETPDPESTQRVGRALALELEPGACVTLEGDLGAGKTCFVRGMAVGAGCDPNLVHSPTFTVMHRYVGTLCDLVHVDGYRVQAPEELRDAGFDAQAGDAIAAVEWPARVVEALPTRTIRVRLAAIGESIRRIEIEDPAGTVAERLAAAVGPRACPGCQAPTSLFASDWPFCSPRCRAADLGRWLSGAYQITRPLEERDLEEGLP
jgi:tRNA threonylcarbamoyladenosine biosynthesis protein TsaE